MTKPGQRAALLAGGGATRGAVQVGPYAKLLRYYGRFVAMVGTSIGASTVSTDPATLRALWQTIDGVKSFQRITWSPWKGVFDLQRFRDMHDKADTCRNVDGVHVGVYDLARQRYVLVDFSTLVVSERRDAIMCSSQIPLVHQPRSLRGRYFGDGGIHSVIGRLPRGTNPASLAAVHVLHCSPLRPAERREVKPAVTYVWQAASSVYDAWQTQVAMRDLAYLVDLARYTTVVLWGPTTWEEVGDPFDASPERIADRLVFGDRVLPRQLHADGTETLWSI